jgi:type II secretory pathway component PulM
MFFDSRSQWQRGVRRRSVAARLLGMWVLIPPEERKSVVGVVCFLVEVSATSWSLFQRGPIECCVSECECESSATRRP